LENQSILENQEFNLQEFYFKSKGLVKLLFKNKFLISIIIIIAIGIGILLKGETQYEASTTIYVNNSKSGSIMSLAASFGVGNQTGITNDKISGVAQSEDIKIHILKQEVEINGVKDYLISHFIRYLDLNETWKDKRPQLNNINFKIPGKTQDSLYIVLSRKLKYLIDAKQGSTGELIITTISENEDLSYNINKIIIAYLKKFFTELETNSDKNIIKTLSAKRDSIQNELIIVESEYALTSDQTVNMVKTKGYIKMKQLERKLFILNSLQSEVIKNLELTEYNYNSYVNPLKCIDEPKYPLKKVQQSNISNILISVILGFAFSFVIVISKHFIKKFESANK
tara:strand:+ start:6678 stop:7700 length:1023 start_codon:yes stop_codon:yes gene_type:complete